MGSHRRRRGPTPAPCRHIGASVHLLRLCQSRPAPESQGWLSTIRPRRIPSGLRPIPTASASEIWDWALSSEAVGPPQSELRIGQFAPTSDGQMQVSTARNVAMTPPQCPTTEADRDPYFPEGVLPQRLHQEPEATRPFLQYARRVSRLTSPPDIARRERRKK